MRPTELCHPKRNAFTRTSLVPSSSRHFRGADTPRRLRLRAVSLGDRTFHDARTASADRTQREIPSRDGVGVVFPRRRMRPSLWHPCRDLPFILRLSRLPGSCNVAVRLPFEELGTGRRMRKTAKTTLRARS